MADPNEINDIDDLFSTNDKESDDMGDFFSSNADPFAKEPDSTSDSLEPDFDVQASSSVSESNPFNNAEASIPLPEGFGENAGIKLDKDVEEEGKGKKGKKAKKEKAPKVKTEKVKKVKTPKVKEPKGDIKDKGAARCVYLLGLIFLLFIIAGNVMAFMAAGAACITFLVIFDVLGLFLLLVPCFMLKALRKAPLDLFDTFLALAAAFAIVSCMIVLALQAATYGKAIKAAANTLPAVVETLEC